MVDGSVTTQELFMPLFADIFATTLETEYVPTGIIYRVWWEWQGAIIQTAFKVWRVVEDGV